MRLDLFTASFSVIFGFFPNLKFGALLKIHFNILHSFLVL